MNTRSHLRQEQMIRERKQLEEAIALSKKEKATQNKSKKEKNNEKRKNSPSSISKNDKQEKPPSKQSTTKPTTNQKQRKTSASSASESQEQNQKQSIKRSESSKQTASSKKNLKGLSEKSEDSMSQSTETFNKKISKAKQTKTKKVSDNSISEESKPSKTKNKNKPVPSESSDTQTKNKPSKTKNKPMPSETSDSQVNKKQSKTKNKQMPSESSDSQIKNKSSKSKNKPMPSETSDSQVNNKSSKSKNKPIPSESSDSQVNKKQSKSKNKPMPSESSDNQVKNKSSKNKKKQISTESDNSATKRLQPGQYGFLTTISKDIEQDNDDSLPSLSSLLKTKGRPKGSKNKPKEKSTEDNDSQQKSDGTPKTHGRPKGSKNKPKTTESNDTDSQSKDLTKTDNKSKEGTTDNNESIMKPKGRPKGSKNKPKDLTSEDIDNSNGSQKPKGRPKGSKNKPKELTSEDPESTQKSTKSKGSRNKPKIRDGSQNPLSSSEGIVKHKGRPKGSKNTPKNPKHKGRPKGSKNKPKVFSSPKSSTSNGRRRNLLDKLEPESFEEEESSHEENVSQKEESSSSEEGTLKQSMMEILQSEFPEPKFEGNGQLGVNGYRYYQKAFVDDFECQVGDSILVITDAVDNTYPAKILELYENRQKNKMAKVLWYMRRHEFGPEAKSYLMNRELVLTEKEDEIPLDSMKALITIYDSPAPLGKDANKKCQFLTDKFFCNRGFICQRAEFVALSTLYRLLKQTEMVVETVSGDTKFDVARARLQLNYVSIVASREKEIDYVQRSLVSFLKRGGLGGCLYLSGVPGTGKTLVVREVIRRLMQKQLKGELPDFQFYEINCLRLESPRSIYSELWKMLNFESNVNPTAAQHALNETLTMETSPFYIIVLVDEIDLLLTPQQNELYCLLEWSSLPNAKFIVIAVANLMDLESRLKPKIASRMGRSSVKFFAYKYDQLMEIIKSRIGELDVFEESAMVLCARSISGNGGDARKALETCKRAIDLHKDPKTKVSMKDISMALRQIQSIQAKEILKQVSDHQKIFLTAFLQALKIGQKTTVQIREINERARSIGKQIGIPAISNYQFNLIANQLVTMNIIKGHKDGQLNASSMISLQAFDQELIFNLSKQEELVQFLPKLEVNYD